MRTTKRQTITGTVVSNRMQKTVVVEVETQKQHPHYKKFMRVRKKYKAHDEENKCELGDIVVCMETRPVSKDKKWRVVEVLRKHFVSTAEIVETDELVMKKEKPSVREMEETAEAGAGVAAGETTAGGEEQKAREEQQETGENDDPGSDKA